MSTRKIIISAAVTLTLLVVSGAVHSLYGQHYIGGRVGFGSGSSRFYPKEDMSSLGGRYSGGISWKYYSAERYLGGIEVDIIYMQRGFKRKGDYVAREFGGYSDDDTGVYERSVNSVMVPIFWQPHAYMFKRKMRVFLNLGVTFSYNINSMHQATTQDPDIPSGILLEKQKYSMMLTRDNRWGYGLCFGLGVGWSVRRVEIFAEGRYYFGLSDVLRNPTKYELNPHRSPLDDMQFAVGVFLRLGKGDVLARPSRRVQEKLERLEMERAQIEVDEVVGDVINQEGVEVISEDVEAGGAEHIEKSKKELKREIKELKKEIATEKKREKKGSGVAPEVEVEVERIPETTP